MGKRYRNSSENNQSRKKKCYENTCAMCNQPFKHIIKHNKYLGDTSNELIALTNEKLSLFTGKETMIHESDQLPTHKITCFNIYDEHGHLCGFDNELIENNICLYISGYIKPIYDEDPLPKNGIRVHKAGPISEWYISGFDGGRFAIVGIITNFAQYILMEPDELYTPFMEAFKTKIALVKTVIEFLLGNSWKDPSFEELLSHLESAGIDEDFLIEHAQFLCDQVSSFDEARDNDESSLINMSCVKALIHLVGVNLTEGKKLLANYASTNVSIIKGESFKATTTSLVQSVFEEDCTINRNSKNQRNSPNLNSFTTNRGLLGNNEILGEIICREKKRTFYESVKIGEIEIRPGDSLEIDVKRFLSIGKVSYIFSEDGDKACTIHMHKYCYGSKTILGETANGNEVFSVDCCEEFPLNKVVRIINIQKVLVQENNEISFAKNDFYCSKEYNFETGSFTCYNELKVKNIECSNCIKLKNKINFLTPTLSNNVVEWRGHFYTTGTHVFLNPSVYVFNRENLEQIIIEPPNVDENLYPEYVRKTKDKSDENDSDPFIIGQIEEIITRTADEISIKVRLFYRPENTKDKTFLPFKSDINLLYWTEEVIATKFHQVNGECYVRFFECSEEANEWCEGGAYRFYFTQSYDTKTKNFESVPLFASTLKQVALDSKEIDKPLKCLDVFAGCGGLSYGLHQSGVATTKWAIENEPKAAEAYKLNNQSCKVFIDDCNNLLHEIISGKGALRGLPGKGDVDLLVGGPPCQGFSAMNQFQTGEQSVFKNSLVVSFLSYCDYLRPKYFILENVQNFATFQRGMTLKLTIKCLLRMGYQVRYGILQAGNYGVPQQRRRFILIAAAPGIQLPYLPEPEHVFNKRRCQLAIVVDGIRLTNGQKWTESAPYRQICVRDAISDLPEITNGSNKTEMEYDSEALSHFQRKIRNGSDILLDHISKKMAPIVAARIRHIPTAPGSDWRDLPNIVVTLLDGTKTNLLKYPYINRTLKCKGVCQCILGKKCNPSDRQVRTLIPWCLPHTANRHNNWAGLYGRLEWDGYFWTTITNPEPMGKQGRILHPEENRVVSVRECARSQGFPDCFRFYGNVLDKHKQIGNAVPPPLGRAIGLSIKKAFLKTEKKFVI